jgi:hypothetical protein
MLIVVVKHASGNSVKPIVTVFRRQWWLPQRLTYGTFTEFGVVNVFSSESNIGGPDMIRREFIVYSRDYHGSRIFDVFYLFYGWWIIAIHGRYTFRVRESYINFDWIPNPGSLSFPFSWFNPSLLWIRTSFWWIEHSWMHWYKALFCMVSEFFVFSDSVFEGRAVTVILKSV